MLIESEKIIKIIQDDMEKMFNNYHIFEILEPYDAGRIDGFYWILEQIKQLEDKNVNTSGQDK